jgi:hypothetical protein
MFIAVGMHRYDWAKGAEYAAPDMPTEVILMRINDTDLRPRRR